MAEKVPLDESPRPIEGLQREESVHPGLQPSVTQVPVTPGIHLSTYIADSSGDTSHSYFAHNVGKLRERMAQSPSEAAEGAKSGHDILRRMSLTGPHRDSLSDVDP